MDVSKVILYIGCLQYLAASGNGLHKRASGSADQIRVLVHEEKALREKLKTKVRQLQAETNSLGDTIVPCTCQNDTLISNSNDKVAYTGTLPSSMSSLTGSSVFNFSSNLVNVGLGFRPTTGHFVAPASGLYGFSLAIYMAPGYWAGVRLVDNGNVILSVRTGHYRGSSSTDRRINMAANYVIRNITVGDEVWPQYVTGSGRLWAEGVTTFSAVLLHSF